MLRPLAYLMVMLCHGLWANGYGPVESSQTLTLGITVRINLFLTYFRALDTLSNSDIIKVHQRKGETHMNDAIRLAVNEQYADAKYPTSEMDDQIIALASGVIWQAIKDDGIDAIHDENVQAWIQLVAKYSAIDVSEITQQIINEEQKIA